jgi:hypothetical protein
MIQGNLVRSVGKGYGVSLKWSGFDEGTLL